MVGGRARLGPAGAAGDARRGRHRLGRLRGLAAATFRGFSEFGWIGGRGDAAHLAAHVPDHADRHRAPQPAAAGARQVRPLTDADQRLLLRERGRPGSRPASSWPWPRRGAAIGLCARLARRATSRRDINAMRNRDSLRTGSGSWDQRMNDLFGVWLNPVVALAPTPGGAPGGRRAGCARAWALATPRPPSASRPSTTTRRPRPSRTRAWRGCRS